MQMLNPLAFMKIGALPRDVLHVSRIHQTRLDPVSFQHVVHRNPIHSSGLHCRRGDATIHQPFGHLVQIAGEGLALSDGMLIPVHRHGYIDLSGSDVYAPTHSARMPNGPVAPTGSVLLFACCGLVSDLRRESPATWFYLTLRFLPLWQPAKPRKRRYSSRRNQSGMVLRTVTTVWCTELGTTLLIGFESTTVIPAYFRCLSPSSVHQPAAS